jgi:hypothetical protein
MNRPNGRMRIVHGPVGAIACVVLVTAEGLDAFYIRSKRR